MTTTSNHTTDRHRVDGYDLTVVTETITATVDYTTRGDDDATTAYERRYHARHQLAAELAAAAARLLAPPGRREDGFSVSR